MIVIEAIDSEPFIWRRVKGGTPSGPWSDNFHDQAVRAQEIYENGITAADLGEDIEVIHPDDTGHVVCMEIKSDSVLVYALDGLLKAS